MNGLMNGEIYRHLQTLETWHRAQWRIDAELAKQHTSKCRQGLESQIWRCVCLRVFAFADFSKRSLRWEFRKRFVRMILLGLRETQRSLLNGNWLPSVTNEQWTAVKQISHEQPSKTEWMRVRTERGPQRERLPSGQRQCMQCLGMQWHLVD